jgi:PKD repeat protein
VPFVSGGGRGGGGGGGSTVDPGNYMVRLTVGGQTLSTSVVVLEDIWMKKE